MSSGERVGCCLLETRWGVAAQFSKLSFIVSAAHSGSKPSAGLPAVASALRLARVVNSGGGGPRLPEPSRTLALLQRSGAPPSWLQIPSGACVHARSRAQGELLGWVWNSFLPRLRASRHFSMANFSWAPPSAGLPNLVLCPSRRAHPDASWCPTTSCSPYGATNTAVS
jgi:hypothetical protein